VPNRALQRAKTSSPGFTARWTASEDISWGRCAGARYSSKVANAMKPSASSAITAFRGCIDSTTRRSERPPWRLPFCHHGRIRKGAGFARPEQKSGEQQRVETRHRACQSGERRPPHHDAREDATRADAVPHHARRDFEETVGQREHARHPSPPDGVDVQPSCMRGPATEMQTRSI
jgi:hypothetical protein